LVWCSISYIFANLHFFQPIIKIKGAALDLQQLAGFDNQSLAKTVADRNA
jgi:hypothetical protein